MIRFWMTCSIAAALAGPGGSDAIEAAGAPAKHNGGSPSLWRACGPNSLYMLLRSNDRSVSFSEVERSLSVGPNGASMAALCKAAEEHGLPSEVRRCEFDSLQEYSLDVVNHQRDIAGFRKLVSDLSGWVGRIGEVLG